MSQDENKQKQLPGMENIKVEEEKKVRKHNKLGEYKDVTVVPLMEIDMKNTGHVSINEYTADYKYNVKQSLPELAIQFLEERTYVNRYYKTEFDEDGRPSEKQIEEHKPRFNVIRH